MQLDDVVNDPELAEQFIVLRSQGGAYIAGKWTEPTPQVLSYFGIVSIAEKKDVEALPEADRIHGAIVINCELPLYVTHVNGTAGPGTSDLVQWNGEKYRVVNVRNYASRGYFWGIAVRMTGA